MAKRGASTGGAKKPTKKLPGRSPTRGLPKMPVFKPTIHLEGNQVPSELKEARAGAKVEIVATGRVMAKGERVGEGITVAIELDKIGAARKSRR